VIERTLIKCFLAGGIPGEKNTQRLQIDDNMNVNFSVALYENLFLLIDNLKDEYTEYSRVLETQNKEQVIGANLSQAQQQSADDEQLKSTSHIFFSPSSYFIKNKTGELLMFMASKKPAYTEL
jgi:hypothetical protein